MFNRIVWLLLTLYCTSLVIGQDQDGCFPVDLSSYDTSGACAGYPRSSNFPTRACGERNPILLNGTNGQCSNSSFISGQIAFQQVCPFIVYDQAAFCGDPPSQYLNLPFWNIISPAFSYCRLRPCTDNSTCNPPPPPSTPVSPGPPALPSVCYDCCLLCFNFNATACQNSPGYRTLFRAVDQPTTGCISCQSIPSPPSTPTPIGSSTSLSFQGSIFITTFVALIFIL